MNYYNMKRYITNYYNIFYMSMASCIIYTISLYCSNIQMGRSKLRKGCELPLFIR